MIAPIVAITPGDGRDLVPWLAALGAAGLGTVILREPALGAEAYGALAEEAVRHVPQVVLHANNPAAPALSAARRLPIHMGSGSNTLLRRLASEAHEHGGQTPTTLPPPYGVSCHSGADLDAAFAAGASWTFLGPVWAPLSKKAGGPALGPERFLELSGGRPVWALGGVTPDRRKLLFGAGVAVIGFLFGASSPREAADRLMSFEFSS